MTAMMGSNDFIVTNTMDHGDGRFASRFRPGYEIDVMPRVVGLCRKCRREMWTKLPHGRGRPVAASADGVTCEPCKRYMRETGKDPQFRKGNPAERIPAERPEVDPTWREEPLDLLCYGVAPEVFYPDLCYDEQQPTEDEKRQITKKRRQVARTLCANCPVQRKCWQTAMLNGYEGIWGGRFFRRNTWFIILQPDISGPTIHAGQPRRRDMVARLERLGFDALGDPLPAERELVAV